jgi:hypothetical protein
MRFPEVASVGGQAMGEYTRDRPIQWRMNLALCLTALPWTSEKYLKFVHNARQGAH